METNGEYRKKSCRSGRIDGYLSAEVRLLGIKANLKRALGKLIFASEAKIL